MNSVVSRAELAAAFGADRLVTVDPERLSPLVTHAPTARFLTGTGLPDVPDFPFIADDDLAGGPAAAAAGKPWLADLEGAEQGIGSWLILGFFASDVVLLDGATGQVRVLVDGGSTVVPVNGGVGLFARFLTELRRGLDDLTPGEDDDDEDRCAEAGERLLDELRALDPVGFRAADGYWKSLVELIIWGL